MRENIWRMLKRADRKTPSTIELKQAELKASRKTPKQIEDAIENILRGAGLDEEDSDQAKKKLVRERVAMVPMFKAGDNSVAWVGRLDKALEHVTSNKTKISGWRRTQFSLWPRRSLG